MKSTVTYLTFSVMTLLTAQRATAQEWSFGPKAYLGLSRTLTTGDRAVLPTGTLTTVGYGDATASSIGVFARYDRPQWYAETNLMYGRSYAANIDVNGPQRGGPLYNVARRTDLRLLAGYKPLPWLRLSAGLVGVRQSWDDRDYEAEALRFEALAQTETNQFAREQHLGRAANARLDAAAESGLQRYGLEAQAGIGADIGGLTLDVTYNPGLTPSVDGATYLGQTYALQQWYAFWSLGVGYKLFPLKSRLLAPRKNKAYARIQRDIPFVRNEFTVGVGLVLEDIGSEFVYENRFTHYIAPRFGYTVGLAFQRGLSGYKPFDTTGIVFRDGSFSTKNTILLLLGGRALLLYSRHHRIGLGVGAQLSYTDGISGGGGYRRVTVNGKDAYIAPIDFYANQRQNRFEVVPQANLDYQFLPTDRLAIGPWLRATENYGSFGIQAGYRF